MLVQVMQIRPSSLMRPLLLLQLPLEPQPWCATSLIKHHKMNNYMAQNVAVVMQLNVTSFGIGGSNTDGSPLALVDVMIDGYIASKSPAIVTTAISTIVEKILAVPQANTKVIVRANTLLP